MADNMGKPITEKTWLHVVLHTNPKNNSVKLIGIYSLKKNAKAAIARLRKKPGFKDSPRKFRINSSQLDRTWWDSGFITFQEASEALEAKENKNTKNKRRK